MKDGQTLFGLRPDVSSVEDANGLGLLRQGLRRYAKDDVQRALLRVLTHGRCTRDALLLVIAKAIAQKAGDTSVALALADFILDFSSYLEPRL